jgi:hypothetical protein
MREIERLLMEFRDASLWLADWRRSPCSSLDEATRAYQSARDALLSSIARLQNVVEAAAKVDMLESMVMVPDEESAQAFREMHEAIDAARTTDSPR